MSDSATIPLPRLAPRKPDSNKGDFGKALLIGGSRGMAGSISLSGMAALRSGAGLVTVATADAAQPTVAGFEPSLITAALPSDSEGRIFTGALDKLRELADRATVVGCGPGLGHSAEITALVVGLYNELRLPMVVDADGLNALASLPDVGATHAGPRILTPHPGEFARTAAQEPDQYGRGHSRRGAACRTIQRRRRAQGASHAGHGWAPAISEFDGQRRDGHGRRGRCAHRGYHSACWVRGCRHSKRRNWEFTSTAWPAISRPKS